MNEFIDDDWYLAKFIENNVSVMSESAGFERRDFAVDVNALLLV